MATGAIQLALQSVKGFAIDDTVQIRLTPAGSSSGGQSMKTPEFAYRQAPACRVTNIACSGAGTEYITNVDSRRFRSGAFILRITPGEQPVRNVRLFTDPERVRNIDPKAFESLDPKLQEVLSQSEVPAFADGAGGFLRGAALYTRLDAVQKACLLNIWCKASHVSSDSIWREVTSLRRLEQDRIFALVTPQCVADVEASAKFSKVSGSLHTPMPGFQARRSFKSKDDRANLQITFMENNAGQWAADIDIDEATGAGHALEVFKNSFGGKTHPYTVCELLFLDKELEPPYGFVF